QALQQDSRKWMASTIMSDVDSKKARRQCRELRTSLRFLKKPTSESLAEAVSLGTVSRSVRLCKASTPNLPRAGFPGPVIQYGKYCCTLSSGMRFVFAASKAK